ncbi:MULTISPECIES: DUF3251 domain-containing protein [unclassified Brenneria]|uniref:DUF3251 domain-containing protein n=1 Tax=unclassified Brenneria TaxID=2634434 RepID=UPI0015572F81|nr:MULTISPECIES: DUF3251 domain-containing protein [unclassified Brenneria]MBJ7221847.1 DUF3251 domain-containing protein [Brenneria sp. L3-3C-1]MEE3643090.1 DUF3251 domain-containing protein [Brenneria sp. L3_3C_1]MEE3650724.1 DUF3251 domain-containing protein [Brenneria sp. HEZEL_4_2_4]NPD00679.1 DUF3251 domain-containing protein [Brenneria sp. hezel4-2-4]
MITRYRMLAMLPAMVFLAGCAQQRPLPQLQNQLGQLNQQLRTLTDRATLLEQQNALNAQSTSGVYLLPAAQDGAIVQSSIGQLGVSLSNVETEANGTRALLHIRLIDNGLLPAFSAQLDWGQLDPVSGKPLTSDMQTQALIFSPSLLPKPEAAIELRLSGVSPEQLGFIRLHNILREEQTSPPVASIDAP